MTENKKKPVKKEKVEKIEEELKPAKRARIKEAKEKPVKQVIEEEILPPEEIPSVLAESAEKSEDVTETVKEEISIETDQPVHEKKARITTHEPEPEKDVKFTQPAAELKHIPSAEEFDWEKFESEELKNSPRFKEYEALYDKTLSTVAVDEVVIGTVIQMTPREVVVNIGYKSEGVVSLNEFRYNPNLKIGDTVEVYVESQEDKKGQLLLSHKKARAINSWDRVNASLEKDEIITGYIKCRTKGGMIVDVFGIEAFLPGSQIDVKPIRDYDVFVGKTMEFKVVKINQEFKNVVVSHKALIEAELEL